MLRVWGRATSGNVQKVMWAIGELGLPHERIDAGREFGGLETPEYGALNPNRRIPVLEDGGVVVWESNVIVRYLSAKFGTERLWPSTRPRERSPTRGWTGSRRRSSPTCEPSSGRWSEEPSGCTIERRSTRPSAT